jgi:hypothetical protein
LVKRILALLLALAPIAGCSESLSPEDYYAVWGAEGVRLTLSPTQARFETSCWAGDMAIPIHVDGKQFTAIGNIQSQGGAGGVESRPVILIGRLDGDELRLTVETSFALGPYTLHRDVQVQIPGCP